MKLINLIQKYPHMIESFAYILNLFVFIFSFPINVLVYWGICSTVKLSKKIIAIFNAYIAIQWVRKSAYSWRFITYALSFTFPDKLSLEKTPLNLDSFW